MSGLRYVRNRVHHQWADAMVTDNGLIVTFPVTFSSRIWRSGDDLPTPANARKEAEGKAAYVRTSPGSQSRTR
jgi:hypothetical protein